MAQRLHARRRRGAFAVANRDRPSCLNRRVAVKLIRAGPLADPLTVERFRKEMTGAAKVIATGGLATSLSSLMPSIDIVDERLTLHGLRLIHEQNR